MKRLIVLLGLTLLFVSLPSWAQDQATVVGAVMDSSGAVIPNAKVTVSNPEKAFTRELVSNSAGEYTAAKIPIGKYVITAEATGFQKLVRSGFNVTAGQVLRVDMQLKVGLVTQEVTVAGNVPQVETETAAISDVVTGAQIANLMLNGRNFVTLALLVPGAVPDNGLDTSHVGVYGNNSISFNGGRTEYNNWEIDGGPNTDEGSTSTFNTYPNIDTIAEFRISTSNYGADLGKHAGATIEVATKAGTKQFHGDVFEYVRNDHLDANDWFVNRQINPPGGHAPKRPLKWNDYGYTFGGPFYIPGHYNTDKSKTFFYWSENWRKYREGQVLTSGAPTALERKGNFQECDPAFPGVFNSVVASDCVIPTNPVTGNPYPGDTVPIDPNAQTLLDSLIPVANNGVNGWVSSSGTATNWRQEQIRVDQNISDRTSLFVRYTNDAWNTVAVPSLWAWANYDTVKTPFIGPGKSAVFHITHSFKPNLMNEFIMGYTVDHILLYNQVGESSVLHSINKPAAPNWTVKNFFTPNANNPLLPGIAIGSGTGFGDVAEDAYNRPWFNSNPIIVWKDNLAWTHGTHTLKFGMYLEKYRKNEQYGADTQGFMSFDSWGNQTTGNGLADMYLGLLQQYQEGTQTVNGVPVGGYPKGHWRMTVFEPYVQDDWKVNRKLTLNLGVRYYWFNRIHDVSRPQTVDSGFLPNLYNPAAEAQLNSDANIITQGPGSGHDYRTFGNGLVECGKGGIVLGCSLPYHRTAAPRLGFAYDPWGDGKTVLRGGYGMYFEMGNGNEANTEGGEGNPPIEFAPSGFNLGTLDQTTGAVLVSGYDAIAPGALGPTSYTNIPYRQKWGYAQQFSVSIQHEFRGNNLLGVAYVGNLARHLGRIRNLNQIPLKAGTMNVPALAAPNNPADCDAKGNCDVQNVLINNELGTSVFFMPFPSYGSGLTQKENTAVSSYNSLQLNFRHIFGHGLTFQTVYTWAHMLDDASDVWSTAHTGIDDTNLSRWKNTSDINRTHVLMVNYIYELPFFKSSSSSLLRNVFGGWEVSSIASFFTGEPVDFSCGVTNPDTGSSYGTGVGGSVRCNTIGPLKISKGIDNDPQFGPTPTWFNPNIVTQPLFSQLRADGQPGMFGYMGRNMLTGPGRNNWDLALHKNIQLPWFAGEHSNLQFRWETFNTFNHRQWQYINAGCNGDPNDNNTAAFGRGCGGHAFNLGNGQVSSAWPSRIMQFGLKLIF